MQTFLVGAGIAAAIAAAQVFVDFDPATVTDWRTWAVSAAGAFVRPVAIYVVSSLPRFTAR